MKPLARLLLCALALAAPLAAQAQSFVSMIAPASQPTACFGSASGTQYNPAPGATLNVDRRDQLGALLCGYVMANATTGGGGGSGTVTSVALTVPAWESVSGSPVTTSGTLAVSAATGQTANQVLAAPNGSSGALAVRALVGADMPLGITATPTAGQTLVGNAGGTAYAATSISGDCTLASTGAETCTKTNGVSFATSATTDTTSASNISSGTLGAARMPLGITATPSAGQVLVGNAGGTAYAATTLSGGCTLASTGVLTCSGVDNVQAFTSSGTWTKPGSGTWARVILIGAGGGGGSGGSVTSGTAAAGGCGGGGGAVMDVTYPLTALGATETVTIAAAPAGGNAVTNGPGNSGGNGGTSTLGSKLSAFGGGGGGNGGQFGCAGGGGAGLDAGSTSNNGGLGGGGAGGNGSAGVVAATIFAGGGGGGTATSTAGFAGANGLTVAGPGGGSGGGLATTPASLNGGNGGKISAQPNITQAAGGSGAGPAGTAPIAYTAGSAGAGGASSAASTGFVGGAGAIGAGGGGGGASIGTQLSGAGGAGGAGYCVVITW